MGCKRNSIGIALMLAGMSCSFAQNQPLTQTNLAISLENVVEYQGDVADASKFATVPTVTTPVHSNNFVAVTIIGDIVAVNGEPAKGTYIGRSRGLVASPVPTPGGAIADVTRTALREHIFEILASDGTAVGTIMSLGFSGGPGPPGAPSTDKANWAIVGGTGAFLGARGVIGGTGGANRAASMMEDPANRRINGGKPIMFNIRLIPMSVPQIVTTAGVPAVTHSIDFSLVSAARPAAAGEVLSLFATGLGPTVPEVDPGQSFPSTPLAAVNSPVTVKVNGKAAEVLGAVGYPGSVDSYQVNFRVPADAAKGAATVQLGAAWVSGTVVSIMVQ